MTMISSAAIEKPLDVRVSITTTMTLREWNEVWKIINDSNTSWPYQNHLSAVIRRVKQDIFEYQEEK